MKKRLLNHFGRVGVTALTFSLIIPSASAVDPVDTAGQVVASRGSRVAAKAALNSALKVANL